MITQTVISFSRFNKILMNGWRRLYLSQWVVNEATLNDECWSNHIWKYHRIPTSPPPPFPSPSLLHSFNAPINNFMRYNNNYLLWVIIVLICRALKMTSAQRYDHMHRLLLRLKPQSEDCLYMNLFVPERIGELAAYSHFEMCLPEEMHNALNKCGQNYVIKTYGRHG